MTVRARLTLWHSGLLVLLVGAFAIASYGYLRRAEMRRIDRMLHEQSEIVMQAMQAFGVDSRDARSRADSSAVPRLIATLHDLRARGIRAWIFDADGTALFSTAQVQEGEGPAEERAVLGDTIAFAVLRAAAMRGAPSTGTVPAGAAGARLAGVPLPPAIGRGMVLVSYPLRDLQRLLAEARRAALLAVAAALLASLIGGYLVARNSMAPVAAMSSRAEAIGASNLHARLPVHNREDELGVLATTLNRLLDRAANALDQQRRFMADASHELRTPVAIMRGETDVALASAERTPAEYREALVVVRDAADRLSRTVDDIFLLARVDASEVPVTASPLYLDDLAADACRAMRSLAERRSIALSCETACEAAYVGDEQLLQRLVMNLLDNAIKYSPRGGRVAVGLERAPEAFVLRVSNGGPGIPAAARDHIFERFYRGDGARTIALADAAAPGAGLGLSIARWIAERHGGTLVLSDELPGLTTFALRLPVEPVLRVSV